MVYCSKRSEKYGFSTLFLFFFFFFLDSDIPSCKIRTKSSICAKKSILKFNGLSYIHIFNFASWLPACFHIMYCLLNTQNAVSDNLIFKISQGSMSPHPLEARASAVRTPSQKDLPLGLPCSCKSYFRNVSFFSSYFLHRANLTFFCSGYNQIRVLFDLFFSCF